MEIKVVENFDMLSREAAKIFYEVIKKKPDCVLGLATGETPVGLYDCLAGAYERGELDFSRVRTVNLDEYYPISPSDPQSYRYFMNTKLFDRVNIDKSNTHIPDGLSADVDKSCEEYDMLIDRLGGVDVQVLGIGRNGHIGFNEPSDTLQLCTHLTDLTEDTVNANARFFDDESSVPRKAITMGLGGIFKARKIVILASGDKKREAVAKLRSNKLDTQTPASLLQLHPDVILICDRDAYGED